MVDFQLDFFKKEQPSGPVFKRAFFDADSGNFPRI